MAHAPTTLVRRACYNTVREVGQTTAGRERSRHEESPGSTGQDAGSRPGGVTRRKAPQKRRLPLAPRGVERKAETVV